MKLSKEITLKQYPFKDYKGILKNPEPFTLKEIDVSYIYRPKTNAIYAQIVSVPGLLNICKDKDSSYFDTLTLKSLDELLVSALSDDPQTVLQSLFPRTLEADPSGPGTILSDMFSYIGIISTPNCSCKKHAIEMNEKGADWCEQNMETIISWLKEESLKRKLPFVESVVKMVVNRAIRVSRKLQNK